MPRNLEIKAPLADVAGARRVALRLATAHPGLEVQVDKYYRLDARGEERLKHRRSSLHGAMLIHYRRPEAAGVRPSDYQLLDPEGAQARALLADCGEPLLTVRKRREVFLVDNVRVHLDEVEGLGNFLELEAMLDATHDLEACREQVGRLMREFGIEESALLAASYSDLLRAAQQEEPAPHRGLRSSAVPPHHRP